MESDTEYLQADPADEKGCIMVAAGGGVGVWAAEHTVQRTENMHGPQHTSRDVSRPLSLRQKSKNEIQSWELLAGCCSPAQLEGAKRSYTQR